KDAGDLIFSRDIDPADGYNDRGYTLAHDGEGGVYIGGLTNGRGLLMHLSNALSDSPTLDWVKKLEMGVGSNINSLALDAQKNVYTSFDRRGATTHLSIGSFDKDGDLRWSKVYDPDNSGDNNNSYIVRVFGEDVYFGGAIALSPFDTSAG